MSLVRDQWPIPPNSLQMQTTFFYLRTGKKHARNVDSTVQTLTLHIKEAYPEF